MDEAAIAPKNERRLVIGALGEAGAAGLFEYVSRQRHESVGAERARVVQEARASVRAEDGEPTAEQDKADLYIAERIDADQLVELAITRHSRG